MPYVDEPTRRRLSQSLARASGELNYRLTLCIVDYVLQNGLSYQTCNDIVGALENAKDEFQRRIQHPYEDVKIALNGDVYEPLLGLMPDPRGSEPAAVPAHHPV